MLVLYEEAPGSWVMAKRSALFENGGVIPSYWNLAVKLVLSVMFWRILYPRNPPRELETKAPLEKELVAFGGLFVQV